jgi:F-type H+-transporting ATPase subunit delta
MRGVSANALRDVLEQVEGAVSSRGNLTGLGTDLFVVVGVLDQNAPLRRAFTDPGARTELKKSLAAQLFEGKVQPVSLEILQTAVSARWSRSRDLSDALERAGVEALVAAAEGDGTLDDVEDELFRFGRIVESDSDLQYALTNRMPVAAKRALVDNLLEGKSTEVTRLLVRQAVAGRYRSFSAALTEFGKLAAARRKRLIAVVRVARPLDEQRRQRLAEALGRRYGRAVHLNVIVDPEVLGGVRVEIGDEVVDGTVATRLEDVRRRIAG